MRSIWYEMIFIFFVIICAVVGYVIYCEWPTNYMTLAILNVGNGTAVYVESPTHQRVLIDGGSNHTILGAVRTLVPFYVKTLDAVFLTGSGDGQVGGLMDIADVYHIKKMIEGATTSTMLYKEFKKHLMQRGVSSISIRQGDTLNFNNDMNIFVSYAPVSGTTEGKVIMKLTFGSSTAILTAGEPAPFEEYVLARDGTRSRAADILTTWYNGTESIPSTAFIKAVSPRFLVVSAGSKKVLNVKAFSKVASSTLLFTVQDGPIIFHCTKEVCTLVSPTSF